ncbi:hypothetical protein HPP92_024892 [Vanilla planifolia]|uniref:Uncharacterized protein n=1 Tax=Vanilla planifolia TaxID=51239 RepID=A0A835PLM2_VANPL|nr:hypothetical protein HPP92_024892 [Vanilla planifolia]
MPSSDGMIGNIMVWSVTGLLFLSLVAGGSFLVLYVFLPPSEADAWFPTAGIILVGIPWIFWIVTCSYRSIRWRTGDSGDEEEQPKGKQGNAACDSPCKGVASPRVSS